MILHIKNTEPVWVEYGLFVEIPDDTPEDQITDVMHEKLGAGEFSISYGPEIKGRVEPLDEEFEITEIEKKEN